MSAATETAHQQSIVRGWTPGRARRARLFALLLAATAALSFYAAFQPWYAFATSGPARCDRPVVSSTITVRTPGAHAPVDGVYASGCITGRGIAHDVTSRQELPVATQHALRILDRQAMPNPVPDVLFGLPRTVTLVAMFSLVGMIALFLRNGWIGLVGIGGFYYAHSDLAALQRAMTAGDGGLLNHAQEGLSLFGWALVLGWGLLVSATLFVAKINADERHKAKQDALAAGEDEPAGPLDHVAMFLGAKIAKGVEAARRESAGAGAGTS